MISYSYSHLSRQKTNSVRWKESPPYTVCFLCANKNDVHLHSSIDPKTDSRMTWTDSRLVALRLVNKIIRSWQNQLRTSLLMEQ